MEHQILEANTILEAFGNAKTARNDNSSRFGKFIQICFDSRHQINGCIIQDYLLEQSRITYQSLGERNYHVFYQLLAAGQTNEELRKKFHLMPANFYEYLNKTQCYTVEGVNDCAMFDSLRTAMSVLNIEQDSCDGLFSVLSAILWLGNMQFKCDDNCRSEQCQLTENDSEIAKIVSELLGVDREKLEMIMLKRQINVRGAITEIPLKINEARDNRNGMAKALYSRIFTWIVNFINASTNPGHDNTCFLGVLDIFGFENFETNSFEQLCINYANEKLHKFFNQHMFAMEQELYKQEGIEFCDINYTDNTPCLELLEKPPNCIFRLLSEECRMPKGSDETFVEKLHTEYTIMNPNPFYIKGSDKRNWCSEFSVCHFAGRVKYNTNGFLNKNRDAQQNQLFDIIETSSNALLQDIVMSSRDQVNSMCNPSRSSSLRSTDSFSRQDSDCLINNSRGRLLNQQSFCSATPRAGHQSAQMRRESSLNLDGSSRQPPNPTGSTRSKQTVGDAFRHQLTSLVELLTRANPWYVRCLKPNLEKSALGYDDKQVLMQLRYLGMSDLIRIRREGFPIHLTKHQFVCRYRCLMLKHQRMNPELSPIKLNERDLNSYCLRMLKHFQVEPEQWKIGKTLVFLRLSVYQPLEERRNKLFTEMATLIQSRYRSYVCRKEFTRMRLAANRIRETFHSYRSRLHYLRKKRAILTIQAYCRGMFAREIASAMREIKRVEIEQAAKLVREQEEKARAEEELIERTKQEALMLDSARTEIIITEASDMEQPAGMQVTDQDGVSPCSNVSPAVSSSVSWDGQDPALDESRRKRINARDKKEMEELVKVLERHGISLDEVDHNSKKVYADFERLYDVLGNQLNVSCDNQSISMNDDDRCSLGTVATTCDGDSVSCSGQSQVSSTVTDEHTSIGDQKSCDESDSHGLAQASSKDDDTVNQNQDAVMHNLNDDRYQSNSIESIASIVSSTSIHSGQPSTPQNTAQDLKTRIDTSGGSTLDDGQPKDSSENRLKVSTFTGNPILVTGSKLAANGRPLARIEEEPNSIASSPSKTPCKQSSSRPQSLFPPKEADENELANDALKEEHTKDIKRRRVERRILQVQQEQYNHPINPTTAGVPTSTSVNNTIKEVVKTSSQEVPGPDGDIDAIYGEQKSNILEFAEQVFNNHARESNTGSVMRTLTRRRRSVDASVNDYLTKVEMLSYNALFTIPTSHIKMHDPHNAQISCSIFKNLCKYMTGESAKNDTEIRIIQSIVRHGIEKSELRDEIFIQIIRQLTKNPSNDYCLRLWTLLGLVSAAFSPSKNFSKHLIAYLESRPRKDPSITCYAQFCLDNLQAPRLSFRKFPPSLLEIQACKDLTNLHCKIHLLDGHCETLSVHPCDTALDTLTKLAQRINLQSIEGWALYESYTPGASKYPHPAYEQKGDFERTVKSHAYMADLVASWQEGMPKNANVPLKVAQKRLDEGNFKLTLKKRIFRGPKIRNDPIEIGLLYAQAVYNVVRKDCFYVDENLALGLAGLQAQISLGNAVDILKQDGSNKRGKVTKQGKPLLKSLTQVYEVENYICQRLRNQVSRSKKEWCNLIHQSHKQVHNVTEVFCKMRYLSMVIYHCPLYGTATFEVTYKGYQALEQNLMMGVNAEGLVLIRSSDKALINAYRYGDLCKDRGVTVYFDENLIQFSVKDRSDSVICLSFETSENEEVAMLMSSYCPSLTVHLRGQSQGGNLLDSNFDHNLLKKRTKLKMTLEDRMRNHQEVQNARKAIVKSGKLRKPGREETNPGLFRHTLRRLSSSRSSGEKGTRFDNIYGTLGKIGRSQKSNTDIPQTSSDYNLYGSLGGQTIVEDDVEQQKVEVAGATAATNVDDAMKNYPHRYWAYTKYPLKTTLLTIYDPDLEETAIANFNGILTYSGLMSQPPVENGSGSSTLDSSSIDSGIASQQSLSNVNGKVSSGSPSSVSSNDIYDVCPKKMDERDSVKLAQTLLDKCLKKGADILRNEFFLQLIKQTTDHPDPNNEVNRRHWQLLALACSVTYPSDSKILAYLYAHLRRCSLDQVTDEGQFAQFTLRNLQGTLDTKGRKYAPSEMEILSTINCRRVYARVYFLDGQFQAVEFDPCATIAEVVDQIKQKIGLRPECKGYALFQPLDEDCEQVLQQEEKVGDAIAAWEAWHRQKQPKNERQSSNQVTAPQNIAINSINKASIASLNSNSRNRTHKFVFKKYLFLDNLTDLSDPVESELMYFQTVASIKEDKFPVLEQEATILCALKAQIEIGDYNKLSNLPREHIRMVYKQVIMSLMPPHFFNNLPVPAIAQQHQAFRELSCADAKKYFFNLIQSFGRANFVSNPGYILLHRAHVYDATQTFATAWPSEIWIVIDHTGLHMLVSRSRRVLASCEYRQIVDYNSNNNYLMIILLTNTSNRIKYTFYTKQAQQITQQMKDYIVIISTSSNKRRKSVEFNLRQ